MIKIKLVRLKGKPILTTAKICIDHQDLGRTILIQGIEGAAIVRVITKHHPKVFKYSNYQESYLENGEKTLWTIVELIEVDQEPLPDNRHVRLLPKSAIVEGHKVYYDLRFSRLL